MQEKTAKHHFTYNIKCVYDEEGEELKKILEELYISYIKRKFKKQK